MEGIVLAVLSVAGVLAVAGASIFAFPRRKRDRPRSVRLTVFVAVVTFVAATTGFVVLARIHDFDTLGRGPSTPGIQVVYTSQTYDPATALFSLNGVVRGLNSGQELWVVFHSRRWGHFFPSPAPCAISPDDLFTCQQSLTDNLSPDATKPKGSVVVASPEAAAVFSQYHSGSLGTTGLQKLPHGATQISQISVGN